jgi:hypothetical protein
MVIGWLRMLLVWQVGYPRLFKFPSFDFGIGQE